MNTLVETLKYFVFITFELIALFLLISAAVEIILMYIPQDKIRQWLSGRGILGNVMAAGFGALTPFCACSNSDDGRFPQCRSSFRKYHVVPDSLSATQPDYNRDIGSNGRHKGYDSLFYYCFYRFGTVRFRIGKNGDAKVCKECTSSE